MKCGECPVATTNPKDKMDCYFCPFDKVDAFHSLHDCSHLSELVERMAELLKEKAKTKVVFGRTKDGEFVTECGNCGTHLDKAYSNCPKCNNELDWNSNQT